MKTKSFLYRCCVVLVVISASPFLLGLSSYEFDGEGEAQISPRRFRMGDKGKYTIKFIVGEHGIRVGGGIKTRFIKGWKPQIKHPRRNNYLQINLSRKESRYKFTIKIQDPALDGQRDRHAHTITITITQGPLVKGDSISLVLSKKKSKISSARTETLPVASDVNGDGKFALIKDFLRFSLEPGDPRRIYVVAPTTQRLGKEFYLKVAVLDGFSNAANDYTGTISFTSSDKSAKLPAPYTFSHADGGVKRFPAVLNTPGYHTFTVYDEERDWRAKSNPLDSNGNEGKENIWWGDIHSHTEISKDGTGNGSYKYARDVAGLDFYSLTDHSSGDGPVEHGVTDAEWDFTKRKTVQFNKPGEFVTILGYECSMKPPSGHNNVYFNSSDKTVPKIPIIRRSEVDSNILTLWKYLDKKLPPGVDVITIPHHTGVLWSKMSSAYVSFDRPYQNPKRRVAIEVLSQHGSSEKYDPSGPFSYDTAWWPDGDKRKKKRHLPLNGPYYAQDAWAKKLYLGTIASSDDHQAHPGMGTPGKKNIFSISPLAAVYAKDLTRDSIFNAIKSRKTYATTGQRIILDFSVNNYPMGSEVFLNGAGKPGLAVIARGTALIEFVDIMKWDFAGGKFDKDGHPVFEKVLHKQVKAWDVNMKFVDEKFTGFSMYYVKLKQLNNIGGQQVWAWSSPIWVKNKGVGGVRR